MTPAEVLKLVKSKGVQFIDLRFMDFPGLWQHTTCPISELNLDSFENGFGFDGSSIRGWQAINESDMLLIPVADTAKVDPFMQHTTLQIICDVRDPITKKEYSRDPRSIARKAAQYIKKTKIADNAFFGPELEFFIFDSAFYDQGINFAKYHVDSREGIWGRGDEDVSNRGYKIRLKEGYFPTPPMDTMQDVRSEMVAELIALGIPVEAHHHEVATGGQCEIDMRFQDLLTMSDNVMMYKYVCKNVAARHGKVVTFMPKPLFQDNGSGMHVHFSLWKGERPLFAGNKYAGLSEMGLYAIGGLLRHARALCALCNPTTNSYKRLVPGFEAPVLLAYSSRNRSASCRIPYGAGEKAKRVEFRFPDAMANPYLAYSAIMMAGLDGIQNRIHPGDPMDKNLYDLPPQELVNVPTVCGSLREALVSLQNDRAFLTRGDVFSDDQIDSYIDLKWEEVMRWETTPSPVEFDMYYSS